MARGDLGVSVNLRSLRVCACLMGRVLVTDVSPV